jgi:group I intron endonuclease
MGNIGIYCLNFNGVYYIGKSNNLKRRYKDHISNLINGVSNYKMLEAYKLYGEPSFEIVEYCTLDELVEKEIFWIAEFNSITDGLNITSGGDGGGSGTEHNRSVYSKEDLIHVLKLLADNKIYTYTEIYNITSVRISTITNIVDSNSHVWLADMFPNDYARMLSIDIKLERKNKALQETASKLTGIKKNSFKYPDLVDPFGNVFSNITNTKTFAEEHDLSTEGICRLCSGKIKSHRNWKLAPVSFP